MTAMQAKGSPPVALLAGRHAAPLIEAYYELNQLKRLYRQGWLARGVTPDHAESVAEHSFGVACLALFLADTHFPALDAARVLRMALLHDFGEIYAGDFTPADAVDAVQKHRLEEMAVERMLGKLPNGAAYLAIWEEYEANITPEARFVHQIDRLEMGLQAAVYRDEKLLDPTEFFASVDAALFTPELRRVWDQLLRMPPAPQKPE
jgi:putative hydrolases of HD superfamily